jgi:uncharacterized membrane protein
MKWLGVAFFSLFGAYDLAKGIVGYRRHDQWAIATWKTSMTPTAAIFSGAIILCGVVFFLVASCKEQRDKQGMSQK